MEMINFPCSKGNMSDGRLNIFRKSYISKTAESIYIQSQHCNIPYHLMEELSSSMNLKSEQ